MKSDIQRYTFREEAKIGFEIVNLGEVYARHKAKMTGPHRTDFYHILWIEGGVKRHFVDFQTIDLDPFTLVFVNKDAVHHFDVTDNINGMGIVFLERFFLPSNDVFRQALIPLRFIFYISIIRMAASSAAMSPEINAANIPRHIAIIMDGNGRWAKQKGMPRVLGHRSGVKSVREVTEAAAQMGVEYLTLYAFSTENWTARRQRLLH